MKKILPLFSYLLHPLFIPLFGTLLYLYGHQNEFLSVTKYLVLIQILLLTILIPVTFLYFLKIVGKVDSIMVSDASQRKIPLIVQLFLMTILLYKSITFENFPELFFFFLGGMFSGVITLVFLYFQSKISIHMIGISALTAFAIGLSIHDYTNWTSLIAILILLNGVVGSSRLQMKAHNQKELMLGFVSGLIPQLFLWWFWL